MDYVCSESLSRLRIELEDDEPVGMKMWSRPGEEGYGGGSSRKIRATSQSIGRLPSGSGLMVCCSTLMSSSACVGDSREATHVFKYIHTAVRDLERFELERPQWFLEPLLVDKLQLFCSSRRWVH